MYECLHSNTNKVEVCVCRELDKGYMYRNENKIAFSISLHMARGQIHLKKINRNGDLF